LLDGSEELSVITGTVSKSSTFSKKDVGLTGTELVKEYLKSGDNF
jgi:hypothetical protein